MSDPELVNDDHPSGKIWSVYVSEAEKEDKALAESWKGDMEGLLIFAGLFSACVTTFIVEGYKYLLQDPNNTTNMLLMQISTQLAAMSNASLLNTSELIVRQPTFRPSTSALRFNAFWFLSLAFSLSCALSATLVQQWSRYYLQAIDRRSAPHHRARIRSYLHEGIITFKMTAVVEAIPSLLHISVFLFLAGLVEFLMSVNHLIANITLVAGVICGTMYTIITILPLPFRQCPYRTPLSELLWRMLQLLRMLRCRPLDSGYNGSMAESREYFGMGGIPGKRDSIALHWVLESLTENHALEAFIDGIPGFFYSDRRDLGYDPCDLFDGFLRQGRIQLGSKIGRLLQSCSSGALTKAAVQKRAFACLNAISTLTIRLSDKSVSAWMQGAWQNGFIDTIAVELERLRKHDSHVVATYAHYTSALMAYKWQREFMITIMKDLALGSQMKERIISAPDGLKSDKLSSLLGVLEKLNAVLPLEEATGLKIMPARGSGDIHELMSNVWELRKMLRSQPSPSQMSKQILGQSRASSLIHFIHLLEEYPPSTDEAHFMAFDNLCVISGHYGGTLKGCQDRYDLLATDQATQLLVVRAVGEVVGVQVSPSSKRSIPSTRICDVLIWMVASMGDPTVIEEAAQIIRSYRAYHPDSLAAPLALELYKLRNGGMSSGDSIKWMDFYQEKIWPALDGHRHI